MLNCIHELAPSLLILSGDRTVPSNDRPISVTSVISKRIVREQIVAFLISKGYLNPTQHVFRGGRLCLSALLNVFDDSMHLMSGGISVDMVYLDFAKAFDKITMEYSSMKSQLFVSLVNRCMAVPLLNR